MQTTTKPYFFASIIMMNSLTIASLHGATELQFASGDLSGVLSNLQSSTGSASELVWGIIVDTGNNGYTSQYQAGFSITNTDDLPAGQFLRDINGATTDDRMFIANLTMRPNSTDDNNQGLPIPTNINISYNSEGATNVSGGQALALIWFDYTLFGSTTISGDKYGLRAITNFNLPNNLNDVFPAGDFFLGNDPVLRANLSLSPIPEPSALLMGSLSISVLLRRRR